MKNSLLNLSDPFFSTRFLGFDSLFDSLRTFSEIGEDSRSYPLYNIKRDGNDITIEVAVAGLSEEDLTVETKENNLSVWESHSEDQPYVSRYPRGTTLPAENYSEANEEFKTGEKENDRLRPDTNRLARNASHPVLASKDNAALTGVMIAHGDQTLRDEFEELPRGYADGEARDAGLDIYCLLYTSPSPRDS